MSVVRDQTGKAVINMVIKNGADDHRHIVPCAAVAHQCIHAVPHLLQYILRAR